MKNIRIVSYENIGGFQLISSICETELSFRKDGTIGGSFPRLLAEEITTMESFGKLGKIEIFITDESISGE